MVMTTSQRTPPCRRNPPKRPVAPVATWQTWHRCPCQRQHPWRLKNRKKIWATFLGEFSLTLQGINISPWQGIFEDDFPFPQVGYVNFVEGMYFGWAFCWWWWAFPWATKVRVEHQPQLADVFFVFLVSWDGSRWFWEKWNLNVLWSFFWLVGKERNGEIAPSMAPFLNVVCLAVESAPVPCWHHLHFLGTRTWKEFVGSLGSKDFFYSKVVPVIAWRFDKMCVVFWIMFISDLDNHRYL